MLDDCDFVADLLEPVGEFVFDLLSGGSEQTADKSEVRSAAPTGPVDVEFGQDVKS